MRALGRHNHYLFSKSRLFMAHTSFQHDGNDEEGCSDIPDSNNESCQGEPLGLTSLLSDGTVAVPTLDGVLIERLDAEVQREQASQARGAQEQLLVLLGEEIRRWRLQQGYTRTALGEKLQMNAAQLACLENGIAESGDISLRQLHILQTLLAGSHDPLVVALAKYLRTLEP
jgi:hypothetical protein